MAIRIHPHAAQRALERGADSHEMIETVEHGESFPAKYGRSAFRKNFAFDQNWNGKHYETKQIEVFAVEESGDWLVLTVIVKYF